MGPNTRTGITAVALATVCLLGAGLIGVGGAQSTQSATPVDSCTTIDEPGQYVLTQDIDNSSASVCIDIQSDNVTFDGGGYLVEGNLSRDAIQSAANRETTRTRVGVGVNVGAQERVSNVTVRNVTTTNWDHGVRSANVSDGTTSNVTAQSNGAGIIVENRSNGSQITATEASGNAVDGVAINNSDNTTLARNAATGNGDDGIDINAADGVVIAANLLTGNGDQPIEVTNSTSVEIRSTNVGLGPGDAPTGGQSDGRPTGPSPGPPNGTNEAAGNATAAPA